MNIAPIADGDAPALAALAAEYGQNTFLWSPGSAGIVARDADGIHGFALLCPRPYGTIVDELWCAKTTRGIRAMATIIEWVEQNGGGAVGGIVREGTPLYDVLVRRGYTIAAHVLTKEPQHA